MSLDTIAIVGASLAGLRSAQALRRLGFAGRLIAIGDEPHMPFDRPPLSKEVLAGKWDATGEGGPASRVMLSVARFRIQDAPHR